MLRLKSYLPSVFWSVALCLLPNLLCGCIYEYPGPECEMKGEVNVVYDWSRDTTSSPEGMSVLFYPDDGGNYWRYELGMDGGKVNLKEGIYSVVSFNNDTGSILFENQDNYSTALITTRPARLTDGLSLTYSGSQPPRAPEEEVQPVVSQPDVIWGASENVFVNDGQNREVVLTPAPMVVRYRVIIDEVTNIESASQVSMAVSGLSAGRLLNDGHLIGLAVTVPSSMRRTAENTLGGWLLGFGRDDEEGRCILSVYALLRDGSRKVFRFDVSSTVANAPDPYDVEIRLKGLSLPQIETSGGSGMEVGVDDWDVVEIELST